MPIGFISAQLQPQRKLPKGHITFLLTDLEGSTELLARLGDRYGPLLADVRRLVRAAARSAGGHQVSARGDDVFAVFEQRVGGAGRRARDPEGDARPGLAGQQATCGCESACTAGVPSSPTPATSASRSTPPPASASRATAGQIVMSSAVRSAVIQSLADGVTMRSLGAWRFRGLPEPIDLFQVNAADLPSDFPPPRSAAPVK